MAKDVFKVNDLISRPDDEAREIESLSRKTPFFLLFITKDIADFQCFKRKDYDMFLESLNKFDVEFLGYPRLLTARLKLKPEIKTILKEFKEMRD